MTANGKLVSLVAALSLLVVAILSWQSLRTRNAAVVKTFYSPDKRFRAVVYRVQPLGFVSVMPGQAGDAGGFVRLYDDKKDSLLEERRFDSMVSRFYDDEMVAWSSNRVHITLFADWRLPSE